MTDRILRNILTVVSSFMATAGAATASELATSLAFDFTAGPAKPGHISVWHDTAYTDELGYGFDLGTAPEALTHGVVSDKPFFFSVAVPEGNYNVAVTFGDPALSCVSTVRAESRRLMLEKVETAAGKLETRTFVVNVRNFELPPPPQSAPGGDRVRLSDRERGALQWDNKLTLEFSNTRSCLDSIEIHKVENIPTVYLAGDSNITDQTREPTTSWGQMLPRFFKTGVAIANHAEPGETLKSFLTGLRLDKILSQIRKCDYLFIQFGRNDVKENWPQTYVEPLTTYKQYLRVFIAEARRRGAIPVLVTPIQRRNINAQEMIRNTLGESSECVRQTAREEHVALIDLNSMAVALYEALGREKARQGFSEGHDANRHSGFVTYELAKCMVEGIKANKLDLARYIVDDFGFFDPAHPDPLKVFQMPASPVINRLR